MVLFWHWIHIHIILFFVGLCYQHIRKYFQVFYDWKRIEQSLTKLRMFLYRGMTFRLRFGCDVPDLLLNFFIWKNMVKNISNFLTIFLTFRLYDIIFYKKILLSKIWKNSDKSYKTYQDFLAELENGGFKTAQLKKMNKTEITEKNIGFFT